MHTRVFREFETICRERAAGGDVLEIGAMPTDDSLLCMDVLSAARRKVGVNLAGGGRYKDFEILQANANDLQCFDDASFDTVLSNAVLEHDAYFWLTLSEIRRVTRPGGLIAIGVPGYGKLPWRRLRRFWGSWAPSTVTLQLHGFPGDFYRFSEQAVREVFLEGLERTEVRTVLVPPRLIGVGVKC